MEIEAKISRYEEELLFDPQTSGGFSSLSRVLTQEI